MFRKSLFWEDLGGPEKGLWVGLLVLSALAWLGGGRVQLVC